MSCAVETAETPTVVRRERSRGWIGRIARPDAFVLTGLVLVLFLAASAAPSPLYVVYQQQWGFSSWVLTGVFAIYVFGLLGSLLVLGALSDHVGRRPVLGATIALDAVAILLFLVAGDVEVLALARLIQGVATGAAITTLSAMLVDLAPPHAPGRAGVVNSVAPTAGLAFGAVACGALVQFGPAPTHLVYALLLAALAVAGAAVWRLVPETSTFRSGARSSLRPRVGVAAELRADFVSLSPAMVAMWAVGGLYLSLGGSVAAQLLGIRSHLVGGLVVAALCGTGAVTALALRSRPLGSLLMLGEVLLAVGMVIALVGVQLDSAVVSLVGALVSGVGFGSGGLATFGTLARIATPDSRGELFAAAYVLSYLAFSVPAVLAGIAATELGLRPALLVYGGVVTVLSLVALVLQQTRRTRVVE